MVFSLLAGCAPLQSERLAARGGPPIDLRDPRVFYETSSYGQAAIEMMARRAGERHVVYGSDRPVLESAATGRETLLQANGAALLERIGAAA